MTRIAPRAAAAALALAAIALSACEKEVDAPADPGVCWVVAMPKDGPIKFNKLSDHQATLENCAGSLEIMRMRFEAIGATQNVTTGAYQGQYLFDGRDGIYTSQTLKGQRYLLLVRTGDGRLVPSAAMPVNWKAVERARKSP
jgi:hypothetical protein